MYKTMSRNINRRRTDLTAIKRSRKGDGGTSALRASRLDCLSHGGAPRLRPAPKLHIVSLEQFLAGVITK